ncbi:hypothetical protein, partial [uncultured Intestinimonas sp.]|uniref:hypothetical protein n=1 Tax=uncultured Intestinimonas sp. TaxID=1689265 RepID=UPI0025E5E7CE
ARSGLHLFEKMLAFLREPVDFVDRLKRPDFGPGVFLLSGSGTKPGRAHRMGWRRNRRPPFPNAIFRRYCNA